jgi:putative endonuclease
MLLRSFTNRFESCNLQPASPKTTGCTEDLKERFQTHCNGYVPSTKPRLPVELIFYCAFKDKYKAFAFERYLKSGSGRAFMQKRFF